MDEFSLGEPVYGRQRTPHDRLGPKPRDTWPRRGRHPGRPDDETEVDAVATWFARIGALALLLAAGYGYKYAVDRGLITPAMRVAMGMLAGSFLLLGGEVTRRREWPAFAQAVTGAGVGLLYLSTWAAYERYGLIDGPAAFAALTVIIGIGVGLAWRHESEALAILATLGGFLNPFLVGDVMAPIPVLAYIALLDVGILALVGLRPWPIVGRVAFAGTWVFAVVSSEAAGPAWAMTYGAAFWALFAGHPFTSLLRGRRVQPEETAFAVANGFAFWFLGMSVLTVHAFDLRGLFTGTLGLAYAAQWIWTKDRAGSDRGLSLALMGTAIGFVTLAIPLQFEGHVLTAGWTVEALVLVFAGRAEGSRHLRMAGTGLLYLAVTATVFIEFAFGATYAPAKVLFSAESFTLLLQVAALHVSANLIRGRDDDREVGEFEDVMPAVGSASGHVLALLWAAFETASYWTAHRSGPAAQSAIQFSLTVTWSLYAAGLMIAGIALRRRRPRLTALCLLVVTIAKVVVIDLWMLSTLERVLAFGALGAILLMCSLMYHRFRELILEGV